MSNSDISFFHPTFKLHDGTEFTIHQIAWDSNTHRRDYWFCPVCKHIWKGHKRLWRQGKTPTRCPRCYKYRIGKYRIRKVKK